MGNGGLTRVLSTGATAGIKGSGQRDPLVKQKGRAAKRTQDRLGREAAQDHTCKKTGKGRLRATREKVGLNGRPQQGGCRELALLKNLHPGNGKGSDGADKPFCTDGLIKAPEAWVTRREARVMAGSIINARLGKRRLH